MPFERALIHVLKPSIPHQGANAPFAGAARWAVLCGAMLACSAPRAVAALPPEPWNPTALVNEHVDLAVRYSGGSWSLAFRNEDVFPPQTLSTSDVVAWMGPQARTLQPALPQWSFIGAGAGASYWRLPQTQNSQLLYLGANSTGVSGLASWNTGDPRLPSVSLPWVKLSVLDVRGPAGGHFSLWQDGATPTVWIDTADGINHSGSDNDVFYLPSGAHNHFNWGFTQPGLYEIDVAASAFLGAGQSNPTSSATTTFYFAVETPLTAAAVASPRNNQVVHLDIAGRGTTYPHPAGPNSADEFTVGSPLAVEYDAAGNLFVADSEAGRVVRYGPGGEPTVVADSSHGLVSPSGLAFDSAGNLYVSDRRANSIFRFDAAGDVSLLAGPEAGLAAPFALAVDSADRVYVANFVGGNVLRFDQAGLGELFVGGDQGLLAPLGLEIDGQDRLYVSDFGGGSVLRFTQQGGTELLVSGLTSPAGLALDESATFDPLAPLFITDVRDNRIVRYNPSTGQVLTHADASAGLSNPYDLAFAPYRPAGSAGPLLAGALLAGSGPLAVPEPSSVWLLLLGGAIALTVGACRRRSSRGSAAVLVHAGTSGGADVQGARFFLRPTNERRVRHVSG